MKTKSLNVEFHSLVNLYDVDAKITAIPTAFNK